jgi:hypothetical protein
MVSDEGLCRLVQGIIDEEQREISTMGRSAEQLLSTQQPGESLAAGSDR